MARKKQKKRITPLDSIFLRVFLICFVCAVCIGVYGQYEKYTEIEQQMGLVALEIEAEHQKTADQENLREYYNTDSYIEQIAREQLGLLKPGEKVYVNRAN